MGMCIICNQRDAQIEGKYCHFACYAMSPEGIAEVVTRHGLKAAQKAARMAALASNGGGPGGNGAAMQELLGYRDDDDGVDR